MKYLYIFLSFLFAGAFCFADEAAYNKYISDSAAAGYSTVQTWKLIQVLVVGPEKAEGEKAPSERKKCTYYILKNSQYKMVLMKNPEKTGTGKELSSGNADVLLSLEGYNKPVRILLYDSAKTNLGLFEAVFVKEQIFAAETEQPVP